MKKIFFVLLVLIILISGCQKNSGSKTEAKEAKSLSEMQVAACNAAHDAGTCDTRLAELGIVLKEDCCQVLQKCC